MAKKRYQVMVDTWGSAPEFKRGRVLDLDLDDKDAMAAFPYDARSALDRGVLIDLDEREQQAAADQAAIQAAAEQRERETTPPAPASSTSRTTRPGTSHSSPETRQDAV